MILVVWIQDVGAPYGRCLQRGIYFVPIFQKIGLSQKFRNSGIQGFGNLGIDGILSILIPEFLNSLIPKFSS